MKLNEELPYNKTVFMTTHNSYAIKVGIKSQLTRGIRGIELDIHNPHFEQIRHFKIGHIRGGEGVSHANGNLKGVIFDDWLELIKNWSDANPNHEPITLFIDIKNNLVARHATEEIILLNQTLLDKFTPDKLYTPENLGMQNNNWPTLSELRNRIIVFLTGHTQTKWDYWTKIPSQELTCFLAYNYPADDDNAYSKDMLQEAKIVNTEAEHWKWANNQLNNGKMIRLWDYNPHRLPYHLTIKFPLDHWPSAKCNFPATDQPFKFVWGNWYQKSCKVLQDKLLSSE